MKNFVISKSGVKVFKDYRDNITIDKDLDNIIITHGETKEEKEEHDKKWRDILKMKKHKNWRGLSIDESVMEAGEKITVVRVEGTKFQQNPEIRNVLKEWIV